MLKQRINIGRTPINSASFNGHLYVVKYLHEECHADVETKDNNGWTPINIASRYGHLEVVKYLHEQCNAKITEETIKDAEDEVKEYLLSKKK